MDREKNIIRHLLGCVANANSVVLVTLFLVMGGVFAIYDVAIERDKILVMQHDKLIGKTNLLQERVVGMTRAIDMVLSDIGLEKIRTGTECKKELLDNMVSRTPELSSLHIVTFSAGTVCSYSNGDIVQQKYDRGDLLVSNHPSPDILQMQVVHKNNYEGKIYFYKTFSGNKPHQTFAVIGIMDIVYIDGLVFSVVDDAEAVKWTP
ncbi:MAG: hypothetical protein AABY83_01030 [Pseudomonadota bacterium]